MKEKKKKEIEDDYLRFNNCLYITIKRKNWKFNGAMNIWFFVEINDHMKFMAITYQAMLNILTHAISFAIFMINIFGAC